MIQRTRAPLSSLEPLSRPHFAPARPAQRPWADSAGEITETTPDESRVADQHPRLDARSELPREELTRIHRADGKANSAAAPRPGEAEPLAEPPKPGLRSELRSAAASNHTPDADQTQPEPPAASNHTPDADQTQPEPPAASHHTPVADHTQPEPPAASHHSPDADRIQPEPVATPAQRPGGSASGDALGPGIKEPASPATAEPGAAPAVRPVTVPARLLPTAARAHAHEGSGRSPAPQEPAADIGGGRPDVTISIGHIEVRAAPPVERTRTRPPFRPRVSLDDFLNQRQDRRR